MTTADSWADYERANRRANHIYATQPITACIGTTTDRNGTHTPCKAIGDGEDNLCRACRKTKEKP